MNVTETLSKNATIPVGVGKTDNTVEMVDVARVMHWYSSVVFGSVFVVIGLIGNTLSIIVWNRKPLRCSTGTYLVCQALSHIIALLFFFFTDTVVMLDPEVKKHYSYGVFYSYIGYPMAYLSIIISIWMTVGVTVDRYILVCWIRYSKEMCNNKRALHGIGIISFLCFIINTPHFFTYNPVLDRNATDGTYKLSEFGKGVGSQNYEFWVHCMFLVLVPWVTIFTLNMLIIRKVWASGDKMSGMKSAYAKEKTKKSENQLTILLLTVTFIFLVLLALQCITQCFFMLEPEIVNNELVDEAYAVAKLGMVINGSISFFLYCFSGRRFRKELFTIMGWNCTSDDEDDTYTSSSYSAEQTRKPSDLQCHDCPHL